MKTSNNDKQKEKKDEKIPVKPQGLNFRLLVHQLTDEFKIKVVLGEVDLKTIFDIREPSEKYLVNLIKYDIKDKLPLVNHLLETKEQKTNLLISIKNKISQFKF